MAEVKVTFYSNFHLVDSAVGVSSGIGEPPNYVDNDGYAHRRHTFRVTADGGSYRIGVVSDFYNVFETTETRYTAPIAWNADSHAIAAALNAIGETIGSPFEWEGLGEDEIGRHLTDVTAAVAGAIQRTPDGFLMDVSGLTGHKVWAWDEDDYIVDLVKGGCANESQKGRVQAEGDAGGVVPKKKRVHGGRSTSKKGPPEPPPLLIAEEFRHDTLELDEDNLSQAWRAHQSLTEYESTSWVKRYVAGLDLFNATMAEAHTFAYDWTVPLIDCAQFVVSAEEESPIRQGFFGWRFFLKVNGVYQRKFRGGWMLGRMDNPRQVRTHVEWRNLSTQFDGSDLVPSSAASWLAASQQVFIPNGNEPAEEFGNNSRLFENAIALGLPLPKHQGQEITVAKGDLVTIHARALGLEYFSTGTTEEPDNFKRASEHTGWMAEQVAPALPRLPFTFRRLDPA